MATKDVWVIIPAHNERAHISDVVRRTKVQGVAHVVVVDDGSSDETSRLAVGAGAIVLRHVVNLGKGAAMKTGAEYARVRGAKALIFMDSDGQHKPEDLPCFFQALRKGNAVVFSYRRRVGSMPFIRRFGNWLICFVLGLFYNVHLQDGLCGYRAMTVNAYNKIKWDSRDYSVESEMIARAGKQNLKYTEVEVATIYHDKYKGMTVIDGVRIVLNLVWWRMTH